MPQFAPARLIAAALFLMSGALYAAQDHAGHAGHHDQLGDVDFPISCNDDAQQHFDAGLVQLHHMMYNEAMPHFESAAEADPNCAMAHWGIAMASFQPLWHPTPPAQLQRGKAAVEQAKEIGAKTERERGHLAAAAAFFTDPEPAAPDRASDHEARLKAWMQAQRDVHEAHPDDVDAAAFYGLAQVSYAMTQFSPAEEHDFSRQREAGALLERYLADNPQHPGLYHYAIHAYDSAELAEHAEALARDYGELAPNTPHALHMPSHIFVRLGKWEETAAWNERSAQAALRHPVNGRTSLHYPHALDYMMYAYLQLGNEAKARQTFEAIRSLENVQPELAAAYNMAAAQARYYLERQRWEEAAALEPRYPDSLPWQQFPESVALFHYARGLGAARSGKLDQAEEERERIEALVAESRKDGSSYWAYMSEALGKAVGAWVLYERGDTEEALTQMQAAADLEDSMDKHPVTPGEVLPVRELYGELLLREGRPQDAREAFEASLERTPNRRNALRGLEASQEVATR
jgi:tetratricopeptide (TPR) repeat protein